ncbi:thioesterase II family protein [Kitasatospora sp. NPDC001119]
MSNQRKWGRWFLGSAAPATARIVLFCLPNAGGGGTGYLRWQRMMPENVWIQPVQLPGRENRITEPPGFDPAELAQALHQYADRPFALYGHSMGGVLGFEVSRQLESFGGAGPNRLYVGASHPPQVDCSWLRSWIGSSDESLLKQVAELGGVPAAVLEHPRSRDRVVRVLRADLDWLSRYQLVRGSSAQSARLTVPVTAFAADRDRMAGPDVMRHWGDLTSAEFRLNLLRSGHLFHLTDPRLLVSLIATDLSADVRRP